MSSFLAVFLLLGLIVNFYKKMNKQNIESVKSYTSVKVDSTLALNENIKAVVSNEVYGIAKYDIQILNQPSYDWEVVGTVLKGQRISLIVKGKDWFKVKKDSMVGWVAAKWISIHGDSSRIPVVNVFFEKEPIRPVSTVSRYSTSRELFEGWNDFREGYPNLLSKASKISTPDKNTLRLGFKKSKLETSFSLVIAELASAISATTGWSEGLSYQDANHIYIEIVKK